jgi:hypothetical protein
MAPADLLDPVEAGSGPHDEYLEKARREFDEHEARMHAAGAARNRELEAVERLTNDFLERMRLCGNPGLRPLPVGPVRDGLRGGRPATAVPTGTPGMTSSSGVRVPCGG